MGLEKRLYFKISFGRIQLVRGLLLKAKERLISELVVILVKS